MLRIQPYGPKALLVTFADKIGDAAYEQGQKLVQHLEQNPLPGLVEMVPAFTTILLIFNNLEAESVSDLEQSTLRHLEAALEITTILPPPKEIPVLYDGEDLPDLAAQRNLSIQAFCKLHCEPIYKVYMLGFSPGFPYLGELPQKLHTTRRSTPRPRVKAGSVAIGGPHTGIYSIDSPGGWHIIGTTPLHMFDLRRESHDPASCFFLKPGERVRFVPLSP